MASEAIAHGQINGPNRYGLLGHVPMATGASDTRADMRRVIELYMGRGAKPVDAPPGNLFTPLEVARHLLDFGTVHSNYPVTRHTKLNARDPGIRALIHPRVAVRAL